MSKLSARRYRRGHDMMILRVGVCERRATFPPLYKFVSVNYLRSFWIYGHSPRRPTPFHSLTHSRA